MGFKGYKYKFKLNASHSGYLTNEKDNIHFHTIEISLFIKTKKKDIVLYENVEKLIEKYLNQYSGQYLNSLQSFHEIQPTIENIGHEFYKQIKLILNENEFNIIKLEISETPTRVYVIKEKQNRLKLKNTEKGKKLLFLINKLENYGQDIIEILKNRQFDEQEPALAEIEEIKDDNVNIIKESEQKYDNKILKYTKRVDKSKINKKFKSKKIICIFLSICILLITTITLVYYIRSLGTYPKGSDVYGHLFKANVLYNSIKNGELYLLYTNLWYNGEQLFRYWPPLSHYFLALLQFITKGNALEAYVLFLGSTYFIGALGWLLFGIKEKRILLGTIIGMLYFFLPDNMRVCFSEGNVPRIFITALLPYIFFIVWQIIQYKKKWYVIPLIGLMCMITFTHIMIAAMIGIATFLFACIHSILNKEIKYSIYTIVAMLLSFLVMGIELIPGLIGGIASMDSESAILNMESWSQDAFISLNPLLRLDGKMDLYYFGLSIFIVCILGLLASNKNSISGFLATIIILFCTTTVFLPIVKLLPLKQAFWMQRFTPMACSFFFIALIMWKKCRKRVMCILLCIIIIDCIPSLRFIKYDTNAKVTAEERKNIMANNELLTDAKEVTNNRLALMDLSTYGAFPSYILSEDYDNATQYAFGWAIQGAITYQNIVMVNTAFEKGYYNYMFDRLIELGSDTIVIKKDLIHADDETKIIKVAKDLNYKLIKENEYSYLFHLDTPKTFGVRTTYENIAIGSFSDNITLLYPSFEKGKSNNLNNYTFEDLKGYKKIFLANFLYDDKSSAENLVKKLTENGVKVYIDMNNVPVDSLTKRMEFLNVSSQPISFINNYPEMMCNGKNIESDKFTEEYDTWNTVYLERLTTITGYADYEDKEIAFLGSGENKNMIFIGFNILFHELETNDKKVKTLLNEILGVNGEVLPKREIIPLDIKYNKDKISIDSSVDNLNTTIAYQDNFKSKQALKNNNNLLVVNKGETDIDIFYPYFKEGSIVSIIGILGVGILIYYLYKDKNYIKKVNNSQ